MKRSAKSRAWHIAAAAVDEYAATLRPEDHEGRMTQVYLRMTVARAMRAQAEDILRWGMSSDPRKQRRRLRKVTERSVSREATRVE